MLMPIPRISGRENTEDWGPDELRMDQINDRIRTAAETNSWGSIPGRWKERILASLRPRLSYRAVLRQFRASVLSIHRRLTRMKPNRRYGFLYLGSRYDFTTHLLFAVDVSGSMSSEDLARGFSVINRFFEYGVETIDVIQFDTEIKGPPLTLKRARRDVKVIGRGGTSFAPVIDVSGRASRLRRRDHLHRRPGPRSPPAEKPPHAAILAFQPRRDLRSPARSAATVGPGGLPEGGARMNAGINGFH